MLRARGRRPRASPTSTPATSTGRWWSTRLILVALRPYPTEPDVVTKVGARRGEDGSWRPSRDRRPARADARQPAAPRPRRPRLVNLRVVSRTGRRRVAGRQLTTLAELRRQGLIRHLGLSEATAAQLTEAQAIAPVVIVQNLYNLANRDDDAMVERWRPRDRLLSPFSRSEVSPAPARGPDRGRGRPGRDPEAGRAGLAAPPRPHHPAHSGDLFPGAPAGEPRGGGLVLPPDAMADFDAIGG